MEKAAESLYYELYTSGARHVQEAQREDTHG